MHSTTKHANDAKDFDGFRAFRVFRSLTSVFPFLVVSISAFAAPGSMQRDWTNDIPGQPLVRIAVTTTVQKACFAVEERLPDTLTASAVTGGGIWIDALHVVRWGGYCDTLATTLTYRVTGPSGSFPLTGTLSVNGESSFSPPVTTVEIGDSSEAIPSRPQVASAPVFIPAGSAVLPVSVAVTCTTAGAAIRYTTNGAVPSPTDLVWMGSAAVATTTLFRARAFLSDGLPSQVRSAWFDQTTARSALAVQRGVDTQTPWLPSISIALTQTVAGTCWAYEETLPAGVQATNVTGGGVFDSANGVVRWGPFTGGVDVVLGYALTGVPGTYPLTCAWTIDGIGGAGVSMWVTVTGTSGDDVVYPSRPAPPPPLINPAGSAVLPVLITVTDATEGVEIRYTLDGTVPGAGSALYTGAVSLASAAWMRARAFVSNTEPSTVRNAYFAQVVAPPVLTVGRLQATNLEGRVTITDAVTGATSGACWTYETHVPVQLTVSGVGPSGVYDQPGGIVRWGPFTGTISSALVYEVAGPAGVYAVDGNWSVNGYGGTATNAAVTVGDATGDDTLPQPPLRVMKPVLNPVGANHLPVDVVITCGTPDATIRYTTDGSTPEETSDEYVSALHLESDVVLRARGFKTGCDSSAAAVGIFAAFTNTVPMRITRTIAGNGTAVPTIALTVEPPPGARSFCVTEVLSPALSAHSDDPLAVWWPESNTMKWGPFSGQEPVSLTYAVTAASGTYAVRGQGSVDGLEYATDGTETVDIFRQSETYQTAVRIWLEGPYLSASHRMNAAAPSLLPLTSPYASDAVRANAIPTGVCDWVVVALMDTNGSPFLSRSMFVQTNGWVVDRYGLQGIGVETPVWRYKVTVKHRNHLAVISANPIALTNETVACDLTTNWTCFAGGTNACVQLEPGVWGMIGGDADGDGKITDVDRQIVSQQMGRTGYLPGDLNLDGKVDGGDR